MTAASSEVGEVTAAAAAAAGSGEAVPPTICPSYDAEDDANKKKQGECKDHDEATALAEPPVIQFPVVCPGHARPVVDVQFSCVTDDGVFLVSGCHDKRPMMRWGDNGDWIGTFDSHDGAVWSAAFNSDASKVATGSGDFFARTFNSLTGKLIHKFEHKHVVKSVAFSRIDDKLLTAGKEGKLRVFDLKNVDIANVCEMVAKAPVRKAAWLYAQNEAGTEAAELSLEAGERIICGCEDGTLQVWDASAGPEGELVIEWKLNDPVSDMDVCLPQKTITVTAGKSVYFYDLATLELKKKIALGLTAECVALNPVTGKQFVMGGNTDLWVHVFDYDTGVEVVAHQGHHGPIFCVDYHPKGDIYASGSEDGTIRLWKHT